MLVLAEDTQEVSEAPPCLRYSATHGAYLLLASIPAKPGEPSTFGTEHHTT